MSMKKASEIHLMLTTKFVKLILDRNKIIAM